MSGLRAELKTWIDHARNGEDVVVTDRGVPVARLTGIDGADLVAELLRDGVLTAPTADRPAVTATPGQPAKAPSSVSGLVRRLRR